jgi:hypothetical protein
VKGEGGTAPMECGVWICSDVVASRCRVASSPVSTLIASATASHRAHAGMEWNIQGRSGMLHGDSVMVTQVPRLTCAGQCTFRVHLESQPTCGECKHQGQCLLWPSNRRTEEDGGALKTSKSLMTRNATLALQPSSFFISRLTLSLFARCRGGSWNLRYIAASSGQSHLVLSMKVFAHLLETPRSVSHERNARFCPSQGSRRGV